jgi:hypothetical protein
VVNKSEARLLLLDWNFIGQSTVRCSLCLSEDTFWGQIMQGYFVTELQNKWTKNLAKTSMILVLLLWRNRTFLASEWHICSYKEVAEGNVYPMSCGSLLPRHDAARPGVVGGGNGLQIWKVAANILHKQSRTDDEPAWGWAWGYSSSSLTKEIVRKCYTGPQTCFEGFCEHGNEPSDSIKGGECIVWVTVSFSRSCWKTRREETTLKT